MILFLGPLGKAKNWEPFTRLPSPTTVREALSRYLDITSVPSPQFLKFLATKVSLAMHRRADLHGAVVAYNCCMRFAHVMSTTRIGSSKSDVQELHDSCTQHEKCRGILKNVLKTLRQS